MSGDVHVIVAPCNECVSTDVNAAHQANSSSDIHLARTISLAAIGFQEYSLPMPNRTVPVLHRKTLLDE